MKDQYKLDRTAFRVMTVEQAVTYQRDYSLESMEKRLEIALYLTSIAYNFDVNIPPKMDKSVFSVDSIIN